MLGLMTQKHSEKCVLRRFHCCVNIIECTHTTKLIKLTAHLGYKPKQHVTVQNNMRLNEAQEKNDAMKGHSNADE